MVFSENINFIVAAMSNDIKKAKYGSYSPFTKLTKSSNFELTFRDQTLNIRALLAEEFRNLNQKSELFVENDNF